MILKGIDMPKIRPRKGIGFTADKYYQSKEWKKLRAYKIALNPICEDCEEKGVTTKTHTVDHIVPRRQGGTEELSNLRSRCKHHNNLKNQADREGWA
jgi:5-methylcytosine-specific restriction protein A